jgi:hypothetical protein
MFQETSFQVQGQLSSRAFFEDKHSNFDSLLLIYQRHNIISQTAQHVSPIISHQFHVLSCA